MATTKTIDQYTLSSTLNDDDLFLVAKYDSSKSKYVAYNKVKFSKLKELIIDSMPTTGGGGSGSGNTGTVVEGAIKDYSDYIKALSASNEDIVLIKKYDEGTDSYTDYRTIPISSLKGAENLAEDYVTLLDDNGVEYRVRVAPNGNGIKIEKESNFEERELTAGINENFTGLLINTIYGAGSNTSKMPISHNFIELYNLTNTEMNLNGLHLHYKDGKTYTDWATLELKGTVKPYTSFLIVGGRCSNAYDSQNRHEIKHYDMQWLDTLGNGMKFNDDGFTVVLSVTDTIPDAPDLYKKDSLGAYTSNRTENIIDIMGVGGLTSPPPCCDIYYKMGMSKNHAGRRVDFYNRFNKADQSSYIIKDWCKDGWTQVEIVDLKTCPKDKFPRSTFEGNWDMFSNYMDMWNDDGINLFNLGLGEDVQTRTFVFQTKASRENGYVWYRKVGESSWKEQKCTVTKWSHPHIDVNVNKAIVKNLELDTEYEYQVGTDSLKSGIHTFKTWNKDYDNGDVLRVLVTGDPQS